MRFVRLLVTLMAVGLVACDKQSGQEEVNADQIPSLVISNDAFADFAEFRTKAFGEDESVHAVWLTARDDATAKILAFSSIIGSVDAPSATLTILPCMGGFCMDESWPSVRGATLHHKAKSIEEMRHAVVGTVERANRASEAPLFCIFYDEDTGWESTYEILHTLLGAGVKSVAFQELPTDEHLSEGIQRKIESLENRPSAPEVFQFDAKDFKDFEELLSQIESQSVGESARYEFLHDGELIEVKVAPLPPELCPAMISIKGEVIRSGADLTPIDLIELKEMLGFLAQGGEAADMESGIQLFAFEGADVDTGVSVMRAMSEKGIRMWIALPQEEKAPEPEGKKPSSPTSDVSELLR